MNNSLDISMNDSGEIFITNTKTNTILRMQASEKGIQVSTSNTILQPCYYGGTIGIEYIKKV